MRIVLALLLALTACDAGVTEPAAASADVGGRHLIPVPPGLSGLYSMVDLAFPIFGDTATLRPGMDYVVIGLKPNGRLRIIAEVRHPHAGGTSILASGTYEGQYQIRSDTVMAWNMEREYSSHDWLRRPRMKMRGDTLHFWSPVGSDTVWAKAVRLR